MSGSGIKYESERGSLLQSLQERTVERLRGLSGKIWTGMYSHDPGMTLNEILNYLLTDLKYKLHFDLEDYLRTESEVLNPNQIGLYNNILADIQPTADARDFEKLISRKIPKTGRIEFTPSTEDKEWGVYQVEVSIPGDTEAGREEEIRQEICELFYRYRNLCEDIGKITLRRDNNLTPHSFSTPATKEGMVLSEKDDRQYPEGVFRNVYEHIPARMEFPAFYGINDWGLSRDADEERRMEAEQLKAYLSLFDKVIETGLEELEMLPRIVRLNEEIIRPDKAKLKEQFLNSLDKIYGVDSRPEFMLSSDGGVESRDESIARRVRFLRKIFLWGRDRNKATLLNRGKRVFGIESYLRYLFDLKEEENIRLVEHTFFRHIPERIRSRNDKPEYFTYELALSIFIYGETKRMKDNHFKKGLEMAVLKQIPAHLKGNVYWLFNEEAEQFDDLYERYIKSFRFEKNGNRNYDFSIGLAEDLKNFILKKSN